MRKFDIYKETTKETKVVEVVDELHEAIEYCKAKNDRYFFEKKDEYYYFMSREE